MINTLSLKLLDLLANEADVACIVNEVTEILENPIMIIDNKFHIIAYSSNLEIDIDLWKETIKREYVSDMIISDLEDSELVDSLQRGTEIIVHDIPGVPGNHKALRYPFTYNKYHVGFIGTYDYIRPFSESDKEALLLLGKALTVAFSKDKSFTPFSQDDYEYLLERLIRCDSIESAGWVCEKYPDTSFGKDMIMICLEKDGEERIKKNIASDHIRDIMQRYLYFHYSAIYENRVYMLFKMDSISDKLWEKTLALIKQYSREYGLLAGVSYRFSDQRYVPLACRQALAALQWADSEADKLLSFFEDCMLDYMMQQCTANYPADFFKHPALLKLEEYDREFHTEYLDTLRVYLNHFCSMKETAKEIDIHYNTMKYRISMIENIIDESVRENNDLKIQLFFSMQCQRCKK